MFLKISKKFKSNKISFIGLGNMGLPMAINLHKAGMEVSGYDLNNDFVEKFKKAGGHSSGDFMTSIKDADCVITMLPSFSATEHVWTNSFITARKGTVFIDTSTFSPLDAKKLGTLAEDNDFIPAISPVSGGVGGATSGTLSFMMGCNKENVETIKKYLSPMGKNFFHCGDYSSGQIVKICNNLCLAVSMVGLSESLALGVKLGVDPKVLSEVMSTSTARCWSLDTYNPVSGVLENVPASRNYDRGYNNDLIKKDLLIAEECAKEVDLEIELGKKVLEYYKTLNDRGLEKKDMGIIYQYILANKKNN